MSVAQTFVLKKSPFSSPSRREIRGSTITIGLERMPVIIDEDGLAASRLFVPFDDRLELNCTINGRAVRAIGVVRAIELS